MITNIVLLELTRNNKVLKDIYSPLEIDDQWDQRAPSHEDKVEGGNADGMSSVTPEVPVENPSGGGVAVAERPAQDLPVIPDAQPQPAVDVPAVENTVEGTVPGMQTSNESNGSITNIGQMTVPATPEGSAQDSVSTEAVTTEQAPVSMEDASTEPAGTETPEVESDDDAASMLDSQEHDVPASPFETTGPEGDTSDNTEGAEQATEAPSSVMPIETVEPDQDHKTEEGPSEEDAVRSIVDEPLTDDEKEAVATDTDQMPVSPEASSNKSEETRNPRLDKIFDEQSRLMHNAEQEIASIDAAIETKKKFIDEKQGEIAEAEEDIRDLEDNKASLQSVVDAAKSVLPKQEFDEVPGFKE
ncbi:MAG: hypothetical protein QG675_545 [Patescibacteria group bacterium]|nr:hypothetical protein [Patescibacteria group bacterium]